MYGFIIPDTGLSLLAQAAAGGSLQITRVMVGRGVPSGSAAALRDLVSPVAKGSSSEPQLTGNGFSLMLEYRNDSGAGLSEGFSLSEFGLFAKVDSGAESLLYYGSLGDHPQWVNPLRTGLDVRRFPITIATSRALNVTLSYPADIWVSAEELSAALDLLATATDARIAAHEGKSDIHVTLNQKAAWDAKESQTGAQGKVDAVRQELSSHKTELSPHANSIYRKGECLSDATKSLLGLAATAVPDAAIAKMGNLVNKHAAAIAKLQPVYGSYMGTGVMQTQTITLGFQPSFVLILTNGGRVNTGNPMGAQMLLSGVNGYSSAMLSNGFSVTGGTNYVAADESGYGAHRLPYRYIAFR